jgi:hypothetical protein
MKVTAPPLIIRKNKSMFLNFISTGLEFYYKRRETPACNIRSIPTARYFRIRVWVKEA